MKQPVPAPTLVRTYKVKLAYGRDMYGTRAIVRWADGREEDMQNSQYLKLVDRALPRDVYKFMPTLKVGDAVVVVVDGCAEYATVARLHKNSVDVAMLRDGRPAKNAQIATVVSRPAVAAAGLEWSLIGGPLQAELEAACAEAGITETPRKAAARDARYQAMKQVAEAHGLVGNKEWDEAFGY